MLFQEKKHPAELKDISTTPGGLTIEGLRMIERGSIRSTLIESIIKVEEKCKHLT
jgi:pyrroline-5-carboxylate reductase